MSNEDKRNDSSGLFGQIMTKMKKRNNPLENKKDEIQLKKVKAAHDEQKSDAVNEKPSKHISLSRKVGI